MSKILTLLHNHQLKSVLLVDGKNESVLGSYEDLENYVVNLVELKSEVMSKSGDFISNKGIPLDEKEIVNTYARTPSFDKLKETFVWFDLELIFNDF